MRIGKYYSTFACIHIPPKTPPQSMCTYIQGYAMECRDNSHTHTHTHTQTNTPTYKGQILGQRGQGQSL